MLETPALCAYFKPKPKPRFRYKHEHTSRSSIADDNSSAPAESHLKSTKIMFNTLSPMVVHKYVIAFFQK